ncbi:hypothetical protein P691DRAFT_768011 [Macrolepiota fuliginosa MF-IS2]|uniref:Uncharacterized protein n=1 Tax=Macrolepiota fuliginosa MF-IS2 TaxID=1400762 RepID=A0A9P6BVZ7_9AGAR|nr:hypothetical protein P691DRAFT_768011 [Macrolepiota fuliginosa MF-IS2]
MHIFNPKDDTISPLPLIFPAQPVVPWFHDKTIFYAHDNHHHTWYHKDAPAIPYAKGDSPSLMIAHTISAEYGWLKSKDGTHTAQWMIRPGKNRDGYFTNDDILDQFHDMVKIVKTNYPEVDHISIYDNAPTHLKHAGNSLSACHMPKI